jgi:PPK2 family polyphosphate:nucleotide phosphotransferase
MADPKALSIDIDALIRPYRITKPKQFKLSDIDPADTQDLGHSKKEARELLDRGREQLAELQEKLYAQDSWALLIVLQSMDAAGKDGAIKHVMSGVNPQGVDVRAFKEPSSTELDHDYLWRSQVAAPERGRITIFNRSYYEEVLVVRVHPELLEKQKIPNVLVTKKIWDERFEDINSYERYLTRNGIRIVKLFLHVSKDEQKRRFLKRLEDRDRNWKFSEADLHERGFWDDYQTAYQEMIRATSTPCAPWYVVPADHKWFTRYVVGASILAALRDMDLHYPKIPKDERAALDIAAKRLEEEKS